MNVKITVLKRGVLHIPGSIRTQ